MTELLVSVRSLQEFYVVADAGVNYIDIKEPRHGSLGAASLPVIDQIAAAAHPKHHLSIALGELLDKDRLSSDCIPLRTNLVKLGLSGCRDVPDWPVEFEKHLRALPATVGAVAVAYADCDSARSPDIDTILETGRDLGCRAFLIDTFTKDGRNLLDHLTVSELQRLTALGDDAGMVVVLAGSLNRAALRELRTTRAQVLAVRSAACRGTRTEAIDAEAIRELTTVLSP